MIVGIIRVLTVLLGLFFLASSTLDILGLIPYSQATPPLAERALHSLPLIIAGAFLAIPYRTVRTTTSRGLVGFMLCLLVAWLGYRAGEGTLDYAAGRRSWHVVPVAVLLLTFGVANLWAFVRITRRSSVSSPMQRLTTG